MEKPYVVNLSNPKETAQEIVAKLNTLSSALDVSVIQADLVTKQEFEETKNKLENLLVTKEDRINYNLSRGTNKLTDQRYHGGGLNQVTTDTSLTGKGTTASPLSVAAGVGTGTVTTVSVTSANGFSGTVASATTTPAINLQTTITGILKGNGTAVSAATAGTDYVTATSLNTFTNKTYDTAGAGNSLSINGLAATANTGTGSVVRDTSPALTTPNLGVPTSLTLTLATGLPISTGVTGLGTGVAAFLATPSSANLATALTDETGSGLAVFGTNPTIAKPVMNARNQTAQTYSPAGGGTATLDLSLADQHYITMPAGNATIALSNDTNNQVFIISITQDTVGSRTVTWFTTIKWAGGVAPTLTTAANKRDVLGFIRTGSGTYDGFVIGQNI